MVEHDTRPNGDIMEDTKEFEFYKPPVATEARLRYLADAGRFYQRAMAYDGWQHDHDEFVANLIAMGQFALAMAESQVPA